MFAQPTYDDYDEAVEPFEQKFFSTAGFSNPCVQINTTLNILWGRAKQCGVTDPQNKHTNGNLYTFASMACPETTKLGCPSQVCSDALTVTCTYKAIGYYTNGVMWQTGAGCTKAADCTTYANSGCAAGLCTKGADVPGMMRFSWADPYPDVHDTASPRRAHILEFSSLLGQGEPVSWRIPHYLARKDP
ncbi:hypothetical protein Y032_0005g2680 [Ancylostoma ceylanicum]|uniref:SCP domain-containing protein n=1 Tax=Ancylostoma ceylanicum TaxID=53326 RepID=A0A016VSG3_9BILA|nr:hypothetical protein Y032_0005g2680 [Ancylostoma ceylanicum]